MRVSICVYACVYEKDREREEGKESVYVCVYVYNTVCRRERWTRVALAEREEANRLHYANAVQLQLTVAKNRCRYRGMLSRTPRGFLHSSFPLFLTLVRLLFISLVLLRLFYDSGYIPAE